jgi:hypothetical protein
VLPGPLIGKPGYSHYRELTVKLVPLIYLGIAIEALLSSLRCVCRIRRAVGGGR